MKLNLLFLRRRLPGPPQSGPSRAGFRCRGPRSVAAVLAAVLLLLLGTGATASAQGGGSDTGDVLGDLVHIKRDPTTGQPILQERIIELAGDTTGTGYCPIPVDLAGFEIPFLPLSCEVDPAYADSLIEVDYFGRLSGGRTKEANLRMHLDETIVGIKESETVRLDPAGRLLLGTDCSSVGVCTSWRTIDSPMENLSMYRWVMKYGHIQTDPLEEDTSPGGDPAAGTVYHPALDAADWAKFIGPVTALLPSASIGDCFSGGAFVPACAAPQALTSTDFFLAGTLLAGAADKHGHLTSDLVQYLNRILKITQVTPGTLAALNTLPALIRDPDGVITSAPDGLAFPANERFVNFSPASYLRADWFSTTINVLQASGGVYVPTNVNLMDWLNVINGPMTAMATILPSFLASATDALRVVEFLHEYEIPADLWSNPAATSTTVTAATAAFSTNDQTVALTATVTSGSPTPVSGTVTFYVRTAASVPVGVATTAAVTNGTGTASFLLPGGTPAQTLTVVALFTSTGPFATSQGTGTLAISAAPAGNVVINGTFSDGAAGWLQYATPDMSYIVSNVTDGVLQFYRVPPPPGTTNQAVVFQDTGMALAAGAPVTAQFDLGNSSSVRKRITVLLLEHDFSDSTVCTFWLPANSPLQTYQMRTHSIRAWTSTAIYFYATTAGSDGGYYQIDNVSVAPNPGGPTTATECIDPMAPAAPGGADSANLLTNGDFTSGVSPWFLFGQITAQITSGVLEFVRPAGLPAGVISQSTGQALPQGDVMTAQFDLGNSSGVRKRVTVLLHDGDFTDLSSCTFWLEPGVALGTHVMRVFTTEPWANASVSIYPAIVGLDQWTRLDNVVFRRTPTVTPLGTECLEPGSPDARTIATPSDQGGVTTSLPTGADRSATPVVSAQIAPPAMPISDATDTASGWMPTSLFERSADASFGGASTGWSATATDTGNAVLQWARPLDLRDTTMATLRFLSLLVSNASTAAVEVSTDGAVWQPLAVVRPTDDWTAMTVDLSDFSGGHVFIRFAFAAVAPAVATSTADVWWIDEIELVTSPPIFGLMEDLDGSPDR